MADSFKGASAGTLRRLSGGLRSGHITATSSAFAIRNASACADDVAREVLQLLADGMEPRHLALLVDAVAECEEVRQTHVHAELVWTGPETSAAQSRDTAVVLAGLFAEAQEEALVSTFVVYQAGVVFRPLADAMVANERLRARVFLHVGRTGRDTTADDELLRQFSQRLRSEWPNVRHPEIYYDPRGLSPDAMTHATWHAKCVVLDRSTAFVTSANFTERAQTKNVEAGVLIRSQRFAGQLAAQFDALVEGRQVRRVPGF
jgi:phosphatidylserine/phosphatidylglycerophosphate/cardiolipin synthase-like enzyme